MLETYAVMPLWISGILFVAWLFVTLALVAWEAMAH